MNKTITVREFSTLKKGLNTEVLGEDDVILSEKDFKFMKEVQSFENDNFLKEFYQNYYEDKNKKPPEVIRFLSDEELRIQNYVGMIKLESGKILEILPKVQITESEYNKDNKKIFKKEKQRLIEMIVSTLAPKISKETDVDGDATLMDYIIHIFLMQIEKLLKKGVKQDYVMVEENSQFVKGKILFNQNIRHNSVLKHRTYIEYEDFTPDCIENRLLHSALKQCIKYSTNPNIKREAIRYCHSFDEIGEMQSLNDFNKWNENHRFYKEYNAIRPLTYIILTGAQPFMTKGEKSIPAVLFPMQFVYEKYIAKCLQDYPENYDVKDQDTSLSLSERYKDISEEKAKKAFQLRPDIVLTESKGDKTVLDTKWKDYEKYDISPSDAYQMFAYSEAYTSNVILLYPKDHSNSDENKLPAYKFLHGNKKSLVVHLTDLNPSIEESDNKSKEMLIAEAIFTKVEELEKLNNAKTQ